MAKDVITEFTKNQRHEKGKVVSYKCENDTLKISTQLTSNAKGNGNLKLSRLNDQKVQEVVLNRQNVAGSRRICEYEIHGKHEDIEKIKADLDIEDKLIAPAVISTNGTTNTGYQPVVEKECDIVHREIENIKACRASLFMGTLGILGAAGIAILGIIGAKDGSNTLLGWLPWAAAIPVLLLTTAIVTLIHKTRRINARRGYLEAIEDLKKDGPLEIRGWVLSKSKNRQCKVFRDIEENPSICPKNKNEILCTHEAEERAYYEINQHVGWRADMLNSFTSLCTYVYSFAYLISVSALLWSTVASIKMALSKSNISYKMNDSIFWLAVLCGTIITGSITILTFKAKYIDKKTTPKKVKSEYFLKWAGIACFAVTPTLLIGLIISYKMGISASWLTMLAYILGAVIAATAVFIGYSLFEKVNSLRRGIHSIDCWRHTWKIRFKRCPLLMNSQP